MQSKSDLYNMSLQVLRKLGETTDILEGETQIPQTTNSIVGSVYQAIFEATSYVASYHDWAILQKDCTLSIDPTITVYNIPTDFYELVKNSIRPKGYYDWCSFVILKGGAVPQIKFDFSKSSMSGTPTLDFSFKYITNKVVYDGSGTNIRDGGVYQQNDDYPVLDSRPIIEWATHLMAVRYYKDKSNYGDDALRDFKISIERAINAETGYTII